jgi:hypothetical protein
MSAIAIALFFLARVLIPFGLLITLGELVRRSEFRYWLHS